MRGKTRRKGCGFTSRKKGLCFLDAQFKKCTHLPIQINPDKHRAAAQDNWSLWKYFITPARLQRLSLALPGARKMHLPKLYAFKILTPLPSCTFSNTEGFLSKWQFLLKCVGEGGGIEDLLPSFATLLCNLWISLAIVLLLQHLLAKETSSLCSYLG